MIPPRTLASEPAADDLCGAVRLTAIRRAPIRWLWRRYLPADALAILLGLPGVGKSLLAATLAAHVSTGRMWPDGAACSAGSVLFCEGEDGLETVTLARLEAAGSDLSRILSMPHSQWTLSGVRQVVRREGIRLVVLSPLVDFLPTLRSGWSDVEVRHALRPLREVAQEERACILGVMHPSKRRNAEGVYRVPDSRAFAGVPRSLLLLREEEGVRYLDALKANNAGGLPSVSFAIEEAAPDVPRIRWGAVQTPKPEAPDNPDDRLALTYSKEFLRHVLGGGGLDAKAIFQLAKEQGLSPKSLRAAARDLKVRYIRSGQGRTHRCEWQLPGGGR